MSTGGATLGTPPGVYDLVNLTLRDFGGLMLTSTALPASLGLFPSFNTLTFQRFQVNAAGGASFLGATNYTLTSLQAAPTTTPVPEPATLVLLGSGLAAAGLRRRMRKRV